MDDLDTSRRLIAGAWCKELAPGGPYFKVTYQQKGVNLPEVETLVYLGASRVQVEAEPMQTHFLFQLAWSYQQDGNWLELPQERREQLATDAAVFLCPEDSLKSIADIDGLLLRLNGLRERMRRGLGWEQVLPDEC